MSVLKATVLIAVTALFIAGCSSTKLAYRYADWGIVWWVDDYIPLTSDQESRLKQDIRSLQDWHCSAELPRYSQWLVELQQDVRAGNLARARLVHHQEQLFSFFPPLIARVKPAATRLLSSLSDNQVQELADNMRDSQAEMEEEFLSDDPAQTRKARTERTAERVERWLGPLNNAQTDIVQQWSDNRGRQTEIWLEGRRNWQEALLMALNDRKNENFADTFAHLIDNNDQVRGSRYQQMMAETGPAIANLMTDLLQRADSQQLDHLLDKAASLTGDFNTLACTGD